jgi:hypothetical protein
LESGVPRSLDEALKQHANKYKVWNLSLGTDEVCSLDKFSKLAEELDNLQEKYKSPSSSAPATTIRRRCWIIRAPASS